MKKEEIHAALFKRHKPAEKLLSDKTKKRIMRWSFALLILALLFTSYQYYYFNKQYKDYYEKYYQQLFEAERYSSLYKTEESARAAQTELRRSIDTALRDCQAAMLSKDLELYSLQRALTSEQTAKEALTEQLGLTEQTIAEQELRMRLLQRSVEAFETTLANMQAWVHSNAFLPEEIITHIHQQCNQHSHDCVIDAQAMAAGIKQARFGGCLGFEWVDDVTTSKDLQRIFSINTFWQTRIGDCDDFSLFFAAWLRSEYEALKENCAEEQIRIRLDNETMLTCPCEIYSVCGEIKKWQGGGHCEVGIVEAEHTPYHGLYFIDNLHIIEPLSGEYDGVSPAIFRTLWWLFSKDNMYLMRNDRVDYSLLETFEQEFGQR